jgi:small subunit ribosomal protein S3
MGQKTHPLGFRLGITQEHKSTWYANFNQYANILKEDDKIRTYINTIQKQIVFQMLNKSKWIK